MLNLASFPVYGSILTSGVCQFLPSPSSSGACQHPSRGPGSGFSWAPLELPHTSRVISGALCVVARSHLAQGGGLPQLRGSCPGGQLGPAGASISGPPTLWGTAHPWAEAFQTLSLHWPECRAHVLGGVFGLRPEQPPCCPPQERAPVLSTPPPADFSTFLAFPSPEKLLRLGPKSSVLIAQQTDTSDPEKVVTTFLKVSSVFRDEATVRTAVQDVVDALMKKAFGSSSFNSNAFLTRLLIHMGLLKSEDKIKAIANLYGPLMVLNHMVQQDYFPKALAPLLLAFVTKPNGALESCSFARHNLLQTLYKV